MTSARIRLYFTKRSLVSLATLLLLLFTLHVGTWSFHQPVFPKTFFPSVHLSSFLVLCLKETSEGNLAKDTFGGRFVTFQTDDLVYMDLNEKTLIQTYSSSFYRLTPDFIAERLGHANFSELRELDLPHCGLRTVDLGTKDVFINLRRLVSPRHPSSSPPHPTPFSTLVSSDLSPQSIIASVSLGHFFHESRTRGKVLHQPRFKTNLLQLQKGKALGNILHRHCHVLSSAQVPGILFLLWTSEKARARVKTTNVPRH